MRSGGQGQNFSVPQLPDEFEVPTDQLRFHELKGSGEAEEEGGGGAERLDECFPPLRQCRMVEVDCDVQ